jgi:hypothetical protein
MSFCEYPECFLWQCDTCGKQITFKPHHFSDCVEELKDRGWGFTREEVGWSHRCGRCEYKRKTEAGDWMNRHFSKPTAVK